MAQNAAARLLTSHSALTHITPVISYLQDIGFASGFLFKGPCFHLWSAGAVTRVHVSDLLCADAAGKYSAKETPDGGYSHGC